MKQSPTGAIRWGFLLNCDPTICQFHRAQGFICMNALERRRLVKARVIDVKVAKAAVNESRRQRVEAAKALRKDLAAHTYANLRAAG